MKKILQKKYLLFGIILLIVLGFFVFFIEKQRSSPKIDPDVTFTEPVSDSTDNETPPIESAGTGSSDTDDNIAGKNSDSVSAKPTEINSALIKVPFLVQAPFANWDSLHEDACEEASLIMVYHYYNKTKIDSNQQGEDEIQKLIEYENNNGYGPSITLSELSIVAKKYYNMNSGRIINADKDSIIAELKTGRPVIVPAAGKLLENPNFKNGGPNYHMLVITGYDKNGFITNDPGTKKGEGFRYTYKNLLESVHDWDPNNIMNGNKNALVFD